MIYQHVGQGFKVTVLRKDMNAFGDWIVFFKMEDGSCLNLNETAFEAMYTPVREYAESNKNIEAEPVEENQEEDGYLERLRDNFAGLAMQAFLIEKKDRDFALEVIAKDSYLQADAMLKARSIKD